MEGWVVFLTWGGFRTEALLLRVGVGIAEAVGDASDGAQGVNDLLIDIAVRTGMANVVGMRRVELGGRYIVAGQHAVAR